MNDQIPLSTSTPPKTSGLAITSLVLGILGITCILPVFGAILAIVFGVIALSQINVRWPRYRPWDRPSGSSLAVSVWS